MSLAKIDKLFLFKFAVIIQCKIFYLTKETYEAKAKKNYKTV